MITAPEEIQTSRLTLRKPRPADAQEIFRAYAHDPEVTRYLSWRPDGALPDVEKFLDKTLLNWDRGTAFAWSIVLRETGGLIGMVEARVDGYMVNLGYVIGRAWWNSGYATEAVREVCAWTDGVGEIFRVWAVCAVNNPASARVLEKAGMVREGILRRWAVLPNISGVPQDCYCYARVRENPAPAPP